MEHIRNEAVAELVRCARTWMTQAQDPAACLGKVRDMVAALAQREALFPLSQFALPDSGHSQRYLLHMDDDQQYALYLNIVLPGKQTAPHNHDTWAVVASIEGEERNRIYQRQVDALGRYAGLRLVREDVIGPGQALAFLPSDIHSVSVQGDRPGRQIHFYGRALETLGARMGYDLQRGLELPYNQHFMRPTRRTGAD